MEAVLSAEERVRPFVDRTPVTRIAAIERIAGRQLALKCENLQVTGSFKIRGALNALLAMDSYERQRGVVTDSSGNFGLGLAWAATMLGVQATVVTPSSAARTKGLRAADLGAKVVVSGPTLGARAQATATCLRDTGGVYVSPHNDLAVIAGQGTLALEFVDQTSEPDVVLVPVGGGGLIGGVATVVKAYWPNTRVVGVQPNGAPDAAQSIEAGRRVSVATPHSVATGLLVNLGEKNWDIIARLVDDIVLVSDAEIVSAMRVMWDEARLLLEPSAGVTVAALFSDDLRDRLAATTALAVLSGGNVDLDAIPWV